MCIFTKQSAHKSRVTINTLSCPTARAVPVVCPVAGAVSRVLPVDGVVDAPLVAALLVTLVLAVDQVIAPDDGGQTEVAALHLQTGALTWRSEVRFVHSLYI